VVTSRNDLDDLLISEDARPLTLDLFTVDEARQMLARRLGEARVAAEPEAVEEIVLRCGRLPLALAIVAARASGRPRLTLERSAVELREAGLGSFAGPDPVTDVRRVFGWSCWTLSQEAARLFRLLGLHPGPDISRLAAASLTGVSRDAVARPLAELTAAHLLTEHRPGRYALHDLLRAYAAELTETHDPEGGRRSAVDRLVQHYLHTGHAGCMLINSHRKPITIDPTDPGVTPERLNSRDEAFAWFTAEHAGLVAAIGSGALHGHDRHAWQLAWALVSYLSRTGHWRDLVAVGRAGLEAANRTGDRTAVAIEECLFGSALMKVEGFDEGEAHLNRSLEIFGDRR
jgi:hypothetical protein